jgi:serine/threonine protein kinase
MKIILNKGDQLYKYELLNRIGGGNFGEVWLAKDLVLDATVALKILDDSFYHYISLLDEAKIGNKLDHPNLLKIVNADVTNYNGTVLTLIAQQFHAAGSLETKLNSRNFMPLPDVIKYSCDLLRGLEHLHYHGYYHNDIKPSNILVGDSGEGILADYGISGYSPDGRPVTPKDSYIVHRAPETKSHSTISVTSDIYQVGMTLYRLLNGISTLTTDFGQLGPDVYEDLKASGKIPSKTAYAPFIPDSLRRIVNKAVSVDESQRYQSSLELRRAIEKLSFPGHWTSDASGKSIGIGRRYTYTFDRIPKKHKLYDIICRKQLIQTNRETRVVPYCRSNVNQQESVRVISAFCNWVTNNAD